MPRTLLSIAVQHKRVLCQGDVKNAFCHGVLPDDECVVVRPPKGCPHSSPNTLWRLKKTLYGLVRSPLHWFNHISACFKSIGLSNSPNHPCVFHGTLLPNHPPIYVGLYVHDFCFFSISDKVEDQFRALLNSHYTVSYEDSLDWFLGMKIEWSFTDTGLQVHVHQEAFVSELLSRHNLSECNISPRATPFKSGFPVDCIPPSNLSVTNQAKLTTPYQQLMGDLTWLSISTRPDVTAILSLLSEHTHCISSSPYICPSCGEILCFN